MLSPDGRACDIYSLPLAAATAFNEGRTPVANEHLHRRTRVSDQVQTLLHGLADDPKLKSQMEANLVRDKIKFIRGVFRAWVLCQGLGRMNGQIMRWEGPRDALESGGKLYWSTIGAAGGDPERYNETS